MEDGGFSLDVGPSETIADQGRDNTDYRQLFPMSSMASDLRYLLFGLCWQAV